jgi:hypothetical protein
VQRRVPVRARTLACDLGVRATPPTRARESPSAVLRDGCVVSAVSASRSPQKFAAHPKEAGSGVIPRPGPSFAVADRPADCRIGQDSDSRFAPVTSWGAADVGRARVAG